MHSFTQQIAVCHHIVLVVFANLEWSLHKQNFYLFLTSLSIWNLQQTCKAMIFVGLNKLSNDHPTAVMLVFTC